MRTHPTPPLHLLWKAPKGSSQKGSADLPRTTTPNDTNVKKLFRQSKGNFSRGCDKSWDQRRGWNFEAATIKNDDAGNDDDDDDDAD